MGLRTVEERVSEVSSLEMAVPTSEGRLNLDLGDVLCLGAVPSGPNEAEHSLGPYDPNMIYGP